MSFTPLQNNSALLAGSGGSTLTLSLPGTVTAGELLCFGTAIINVNNNVLSITSVKDHSGADLTFRTRSVTKGGYKVVVVAAWGLAGSTSASPYVIVQMSSGGYGIYATSGLQSFSVGGSVTEIGTGYGVDDIDLTSTDLSAGSPNIAAGELVFGVAGMDAATSDPTTNWGSPASWTNIARDNDGSTGLPGDVGYRIAGSTLSSYLAQWSHDNNAGDTGAAVMIALSDSGGGGGSSPVLGEPTLLATIVRRVGA